jgi:FKBP-type peptidyl-prolyl cis-trans isomerase FklB
MRKTATNLIVLAAFMMLALTTGISQDQTAPKPAVPNAPAPKTPAAQTDNSAFKNQKDKFSYALGMNVGTSLRENLHRQSVEINTDLLLQGMQDALANSKTAMTEDEARAVLMQVQNDLRAKQEEKLKETAETNKKEGEAFLAANKSKEGVITLPDGLEYKVLTAGTGPKPTPSDTVTCNYRGTFVNGTEFDSSYKRGQPTSFPVSGVIKGWTEALQLMPVGSKWQLFVPSELAYGSRGIGTDIGPNATLIFEVELLSIEAKTPNPDNKTPESK